MGTRTEQVIERRARPGSLCHAIVEAAAELDDVDAGALDSLHDGVAPGPLHDAVDVDALTSLFDGRADTKGHVTFTWGDCAVTVYSDRRVEVEPSSADHPPK